MCGKLSWWNTDEDENTVETGGSEAGKTTENN
jgi:hypothetical protein